MREAWRIFLRTLWRVLTILPAILLMIFGGACGYARWWYGVDMADYALTWMGW